MANYKLTLCYEGTRYRGWQRQGNTADTIQAKLDGEDIEVRVNPDGTGEFTESGSYIITVYDAAGNSTVYGYIVLLYMNASGLAFFAVLAASVAALLIYIYIKRKRLEIG